MELQTTIIPEFKIYNRYLEIEKKERERKELAWEKELETAMNSSDPLGQKRSAQMSSCQSCPKLDACSKTSPQIRKMFSCDSNFKWTKKANDKHKSISEHDKLNEECAPENSGGMLTLPDRNVSKSSTDFSDVQTKLQNIDFIDRTPSPVEKIEET